MRFGSKQQRKALEGAGGRRKAWRTSAAFCGLLWPSVAFFCPLAQANPYGMDAVALGLSEQGFKDLYDLDYAQSRATFEMLVRNEPDKAFSYLFEAGALWWEASNEAGLFKRRSDLRKRFEEDVRQAIAHSKPLLASDDPREQTDGHFIVGMALGARGQWELLERHWLKAYFAGKKAVAHLRQCLDIDPNYDDAKLGLGWFEYDVSRYSGLLGFLSRHLLDVKGDEAKGLDLLNDAAQHAVYVSNQAQIILSSIYIEDKHDFPKALAMLRVLRRSYPQSPYFQFLESVMLYETKDSTGSFQTARDFFAPFSRDEKTSQPKLLTLLCAFAPKSCPDRDQTELSLGWLRRAINEEKSMNAASRNPGWGTREHQAWLSTLYLFRGYAESILGLRKLANADYGRVLSDYPDFWDNRARARLCLKTSCDAKALEAYLKNLAMPPRAK